LSSSNKTTLIGRSVLAMGNEQAKSTGPSTPLISNNSLSNLPNPYFLEFAKLLFVCLLFVLRSLVSIVTHSQVGPQNHKALHQFATGKSDTSRGFDAFAPRDADQWGVDVTTVS
jgi:hypothetical protein